MLFVLCVPLLAVYYLLCVLYHRHVRHTGKPVKTYRTVRAATRLTGERSLDSADGVEAALGRAGVAEVVSYRSLSGDLGSALVAKEVLEDRVYFRHGIRLPDASAGSADGEAPAGPLVVDIGAHIGLFAVSVLRECSDAVIVGAEPVPDLFALAVLNTTETMVSLGSMCSHVYIELLAVGRDGKDDAKLTLDPFLTAGTSMCYADITSPLRAKGYVGFFLLLRAVGLDNVRAGNFAYFPTATVCHALLVPVLRVLVVLLLLPWFILVALFYLAGPHSKSTVTCRQGPFSELLERAASRADEGHAAAVAERIRSSKATIDLVKIDVEGAEWEVLAGITDREWQRIEQLVVEVHDLSGRVAAIRQLLAEKGFNHVVVDEDAWASHELFCIKTVYAKRIRHCAGETP